MPSSYGSLESPSFRKMNGNLEANAGRRGGMREFGIGMEYQRQWRFHTTEGFTGHIVGDPFALATISIAFVRLWALMI